MKDLIDKIENNNEIIASYGKIDLSILNKINYKIRLDWNYYSNRMEGGTLTRAETRSVMVQNIDVKGKPFKDVAEMQGHDNIVLEVLKIGKAELRISESRIKEIHKAIMYESDSEKVKQIGVWKTKPNEIINYRDEKFGFTKPNDVASEIHDLLNNTNAELDKYFKGKSEKHTVEIATDFHLKFLTIHPFYDGNGRVARILTNLILISCGYPAVIIKENEKKVYYNLLADIQCYGGNVDLLENFFAKRLIESQQLVIDAVKGKDISEDDDLDKKLEMLKQQVDAIDEKKGIKYNLTYELFYKIYFAWIHNLFSDLIETTTKFNQFYMSPNHRISFVFNGNSNSNVFTKEPDYTDLIKVEDYDNKKEIIKGKVSFIASFGQFKKGGIVSSGCVYQISIVFDNLSSQIKVEYFDDVDKKKKVKNYKKRLLQEGLSENGIKKINMLWGETLIKHLEYVMKNNTK